MSTTTAVLLFILVGYSIQQDSLTNTCDPYVQYSNTNCLSTSGFSYIDSYDLTEYGFCSYGTAYTQCVDASCMSSDVLLAAQLVVPALNRANICPNCYDEPKVVTDLKQTCTVWGIGHVVPFNRQPETCGISANSTFVIFSNLHFTLTAESNSTFLPIISGVTGVRFDYHYCAIFSRTWRRSDGWFSGSVPTQGWFPNTIHITQNTTQVLIELPALNTKIILSASDYDLITVSVSTGVKFGTTSVPLGGVCMSNYCTLDSLIFSSTSASCAAYPIEFQRACTYDSQFDKRLVVADAVTIDTYLISTSNSSSLGAVEFQKAGLPVVLTLGSTAIMVGIYIGGYFWRRKAIKHAAETMEFSASSGCCNLGSCFCCFNIRGDTSVNAHKNLETAPIRAIWCWIIFCLNPHVIGLVFPFTAMTLVSAFCGVWILAWVGSNHQCIDFGSSKFTLQSIHITKALLGFALPQQVAIGIIGAAASEYSLIEVQFWWGLGVLGLLLAGGIFMCFLCLDMSWAAKILNGPASQNQPMQVLNNLVVAMESSSIEQPQVVQQQHVIQVQRSVLPQHMPQAQPIMMQQPVMMQQQGPVVPQLQGHVMQPQPIMVQQGFVQPPQEQMIQPRPPSNMIDAQPMYYGNPSDAPPPPRGTGAFDGPSPMDVYQNPVKYMAEPDPNQFMAPTAISSSSVDTSRQVAKRAIKIAGIEVDPVREGQICGKIQELLQSHNLVGALYGEDSNAAALRNELARTLAEELKMYRNDSVEDLAYGLKEAVLLWKDEHQL